MKNIRDMRLRMCLLQLLLAIWLPQICLAAESPPTLTVGESGAYLYSRQDVQSDRISELEKGEELKPLGQVVGTGLWYMVQTRTGATGWVRASDVKASDRLVKAFREVASSTWSAVAGDGRTFGGTYTVEADSSDDDVSGTWTLSDESGKILMGGTWSATKSVQGWSGTWRAVVNGATGDYSGTWSAKLKLIASLSFAELFKAAVKEAVGGGWKMKAASGTWSVRAAE